MDLGTVVGFIVAWGFLILAVLLNAGIAAYADIVSVLIVVGASMGIYYMSYPARTATKGLIALMKTIFFTPITPSKTIVQIVEYSVVARRDGILALEAMQDEADDPFLTLGIGLAVDGTDGEVSRNVLENSLDGLDVRHLRVVDMINSVGEVAPAMGMVGTLVGLIAMLLNLDNPDLIGPSLSVALITTLYGSLIANVIAFPLARKLKARHEEEVLVKTIILEGILAIQAGDNPRIVEQKLNAYIAPSERESRFE